MHTLLYFQGLGLEGVQFDFSPEKDQQLIMQRGIGFEEIIEAIKGGAVLDVLPHPNVVKYPRQKIYVVNVNDYIYLVPFIREDESKIFLKTIFPHRKLTRHYLRGEHEKKER